ncbi:MAG: hypothetical protein ABIN24_09935 [Dyadobacter sp.]
MSITLDEEIDLMPNVDDELLYKAAVYESAIKDMAVNKSDLTLFNSGAENAVIVLENILLQSKQINIFAGNFHKEVCDDSTKRFEKALTQFLLNNGSISVILNDYDASKNIKNNILDTLKQYSASKTYRNNIQVRTTSEKPTIENREVHYTTGDGSMYRLEYDTKEFKAQFCFNDTIVSQQLNERFLKSFAKAIPLELRPA